MNHSRVLSAAVFVLLLAPSLQAADLDEITTIARSGATGLALELMERHQPDPETDPAAWMQWERERLFFHRSRGEWDVVVTRVQDLPDGIHPGFAHWAGHQKARALLEMGEQSEARRVLAQLIWADEPVDAGELEEWRRMIVESYLEGGDPEAGRSALRRLRQDYTDEDDSTRLLEARLYLLEERGAEALEVLATLPEEEHRAQRLLAQLQADPDQAGEVLTTAIQLGFDSDAATHERREAWAVAVRAAEESGNRTARVATLERALSFGPPEGRERDPLLQIDSEELWEAYQELGRALGNEAQILVGDGEAWRETASDAEMGEPVHARAMYAVMTGSEFAADVREEAHGRLAGSLAGEAYGEAVLRSLYLDAARYLEPRTIPEPVRYRLADIVLDEGAIRLASDLMEGLDEPPGDEAAEDWQLRRGRVLILGGARAKGLEALEEVLAESEDLEVSRFLQVVFDLQDMGDHEPALEFLEELERFDPEPEQQREILFWRAESVEALGDPVEAARLYLRSAGHIDPFSMDQWAQTARYRAADALAEAGQTEDARVLYQRLLNATDDEARQAVLRNRIERLERRPLEAGEFEEEGENGPQ